MRHSPTARVLSIAAIALLLGSCGPESLKDIIEEKFEDFTGLLTALKRDYIVGLTPAPDFPNLHCCWVGDRTEWGKIAGSWTTEGRTAVNAGITGIINATGVEISAKNTSYIEVKAEPFYRQQLLNLHHFQRDHCANHDAKCHKKICTDSLKVGTVSVTSYIEWEGGVGVGKVKISNKEYSKDTMTANEIIVGYKMTEVRCGPEGVSFGDENNPSSGTRHGETYDEHLRRRLAEAERLNLSQSYPLTPPLPEGKVQTPPTNAASVISPRPDGVIGGQVIRVSTADADGRPIQSVSGVVVSETDSSGVTTTREVPADANGGAWIFVGTATSLLTLTFDGEEVLRSQPGPASAIPQEPPAIEGITPYLDEAPPGIVHTGSLIEIEGRDFGTVSRVLVNDEPVTLVASGGDWTVAEFDSVGLASVQVESAHGLSSSPVPVEGVSIVVEQAPPATLMKGQQAAVVLRIVGTERPLPITFVADSTVVTLIGGASTVTAVSGGGIDNLVRVPVTALKTGSYNITYRLVAETGKE